MKVLYDTPNVKESDHKTEKTYFYIAWIENQKLNNARKYLLP